MKHSYLKKLAYSFMLAFILVSTIKSSSAQFYQQFGLGEQDHTSYPGNANNYYQVYEYYGDSMGFYITGLAPNPVGNVVLRVYFEGDLGSNTIEYLNVYGEGEYLGIAQLPYSGIDCDPEDSTDFIIPLPLFNSWLADDTIRIKIGATVDVDLFCTNNWSKVKIMYDYCPFGTPTYATITLTDSVACPNDASIALSGTPAGGTFTGPGVTGNTFDPTGLPAGHYEITYTATDGIGCTTDDQATITINNYPFIPNIQICPGDTAVFSGIPGTIVFASDVNFTNILDTATNNFSYGPLSGTTTFYTQGLDADDIFVMDQITANSPIVVDHDALAGDDRGGIAVTDSFVYITGDAYTVRYDLSMSSGVSLTRRDAMATDMKSGRIYTLWNNASATTIDYTFSTFTFQVTSLRRLNSDLSFGTEYINLTTPITVGNAMSQSGIYAGYGYVGIFSGADNHFYIIDTDNGDVTDLGLASGHNAYTSENWAHWGILEFDGTDYSALYRSNTFYNSITRRSLPTGTQVDAYSFPGGLSDMNSFTYNPRNNRWYVHYEGGTSTFGGSSETGVAADATHITTPLPSGSSSCPASVTAMITDIDLGNDTSVCEGDVPLILEAGFGFASYTWNGVNNNWNIYPVTEAGNYMIDAVDNIGCHIMDTIHVTLDACLGMEENETFNLSIYPNPSNGNFNIVSEVAADGMAEVEVTDMQGRKIYSRLFELTAGTKTVPVELSNIMDGVYLVNIRMNNHNKTLRLVIKQ